MKTQKSEKGQALVLIILSIVGLFGFAALAVDGGQLYAERRRAQSAADAAALAAAYEVENGEDDPLWVAEDMVYSNGGYETNNVDTWVEIYNPPIDGPYQLCEVCNNNFDANEYFQVKITRKLDPIFMQILGTSFSMFTVEAVSHARPITSISPGDAVHALSSDKKEALNINGKVSVTINGGNLRSNGTGIKNGDAKDSSITVNEAEIYTALGWTNKTYVSPTPKHDDALFVAFPPAPNCNIPAGTETTVGNGSKATTTYTAGYYNSIKIPNGKSTFLPGMYCIKGDFDISGGEVYGDGVFFVLLEGAVKNNGNSDIKLKRPNDLVDGSGNQWGGMLFYAPLPNASTFDITGGNATVYMGTIFNPGGLCDIGGNSTTLGLNAQVVCDRIKFHGNPNITINYKEKQNYRTPPMVELTQ